MKHSMPMSGRLRHQIVPAAGMLGVLLLLVMAVIGPSGAFSWAEHSRQLDHHQARIAALQEKRDQLQNLVDRLEPGNVDADLAAQLVRGNLNVARSDEFVIDLGRAPNGQ